MKSKLIKIPMNPTIGEEIKINFDTYTVMESWTNSCSDRTSFSLKRNSKSKVRTTHKEYNVLSVVLPLKERRLLLLEDNKINTEHFVVTSKERRKDKFLLICEEVIF